VARFSRRWVLLLPFSFSLLPLLGAAEPDELIRRANAAVRRGDPAAAQSLYDAAAARTTDPGLVAFNAAAVRFAENDFRSAELLYLQTLADRDCPPDRRAKAEYNRGVCLVRRGGSAAGLRAAVGCFERCLALAPDAGLAADARHNLELAKLLWNEARVKAPRPTTPNDPQPDEPKPPAVPERDPAGPQATPEPGPETGTTAQRPVSQPGGGQPAATNSDPAAKAPGAGTLDVPADDTRFHQLPPDDVRELLRRAEVRLQKARRDLRNTLAPTARPGVRDW
jgi:hypothetical protein